MFTHYHANNSLQFLVLTPLKKSPYKTKFRSDNISSYLELQFHGDVTVDCVESLTFPYDFTEKAKSKYLGFAQKWKSIGTEIYFIKNGKLEKL